MLVNLQRMKTLTMMVDGDGCGCLMKTRQLLVEDKDDPAKNFYIRSYKIIGQDIPNSCMISPVLIKILLRSCLINLTFQNLAIS